MNESEGEDFSPLHAASPAPGVSQKVAAGTGCAVSASEEFIRANPLPAVLGALALGFVLGFIAHRREQTFQERFLDAPLDELSETLRGLGDKTARSAGKGAELAADLVHSLADKIEAAFPRK